MSGTLLYPNQYVHVLNQDTGEIRTEVGPKRLVLNSNEKQMSNANTARIVAEDEYAIIKNPYDSKAKKNLMGEVEIREGPCVIFLNYNEVIEDVKKVIVLSKDQAVRLMSTADHDDKPAGFVWQVRGECRFIPNKFTRVLNTLQTILINENEGIYVRNTETSAKKLVRGACAYLLDASEELYNKPYSEMEVAALGLASNSSYIATNVKLKKGEVMCVLDAEKNEHLKVGPLNYTLGPEESVKVLFLSAGKPKRPKQIRVAKVKLGPDFMSDKFEVRTKDNANLSLLLTYKWQFLVGQAEAFKVFSLPDFIGYSCTTLCSRIREEAAQYTFEEFHGKTVGLIRKAVFKDNVITDEKGNQSTVHGLLFDEIKLLISEVDVKDVTPVNEEINNLLNQSIKSNMVIVCKRMEQEANLKSQKAKIQAQAEIQKLREGLIDIQNENLSLERIERAKIEGKVEIMKATAQKEAEELQKEASAKLQLDRMKKIIALLDSEGGDKYLELLRAENMAKIKQNWYVSSDSKMFLPLEGRKQ